MTLVHPKRERGSTIEAALAELQRRIRGGHEFPDACGAAALNHGVDYDSLREAYDAMVAAC